MLLQITVLSYPVRHILQLIQLQSKISRNNDTFVTFHFHSADEIYKITLYHCVSYLCCSFHLITLHPVVSCRQHGNKFVCRSFVIAIIENVCYNLPVSIVSMERTWLISATGTVNKSIIIILSFEGMAERAGKKQTNFHHALTRPDPNITDILADFHCELVFVNIIQQHNGH